MPAVDNQPRRAVIEDEFGHIADENFIVAVIETGGEVTDGVGSIFAENDSRAVEPVSAQSAISKINLILACAAVNRIACAREDCIIATAADDC